MGVLCSLFLLFLCAHLLLTSALSGHGCGRRDKNCPKCPAGQFQRSCRCDPCPPGTYTSDSNCEASCHRCFSDCRPDLNLKVVKNCSSQWDLQCECEDGFICKETVPNSRNCRSCRRSLEPRTFKNKNNKNLDLSINLDGDKVPAQTSGNATEPRTDTSQNRLLTVLCPLVIIGGLALLLFLCFRCFGHDTRLKQSVKKLCTAEAKDFAHKTREMSVQRQQAAPMATANMGSVHVHNPGTVIFSLLGDFSGQIGQSNEQKAEGEEPRRDDDDDEGYSAMCQATPSPTLPLSEEEHPGDHAFFPSQEQGKDSRVSMEEQL